MLKKRFICLFVLYVFLFPSFAVGQTEIYQASPEVIDRIKDEGMNRSQVMLTLSYLTDVIGGRLTGSPAMKRANEWTRDRMQEWGMENARLEAWGKFGRGWFLKKFSAQITSPQVFPLIAYPKAWSPSTPGEITADVVLLEAENEADLEKYRGRLRGKIVLVSNMRSLEADFEGMARRLTDKELLDLANAPDPAARESRPRSPEQINRFMKRFVGNINRAKFLLAEGAAVLVDNSFAGSGGTIFVSGASVANDIPADPLKLIAEDLLRPYQKEAEAKMLPQMTMATEDYNRLVRMIKQGENLRMTVDLEAGYDDRDPLAYNTLAEIPGTDLKDEIVMLGGHLDSWHSGTGATDNAAGCAVVMEAARILLAAGLKPRRTIRVGLWSGEEQGLLGSRHYVFKHFGIRDDINPLFFGNTQMGGLEKKADYDKLSAYYNLDNGGGRIRGVYLQGNSAVAPIFRQWMAPFAGMGATTLSLSETFGTDHLSFDAVGIPGFQFIQDQIEYNTRSHHSNQDNFDRLQADDLKQASVIMAAFVYQTAMMDEKIPRKPAPRADSQK
ncbi:MAG: M20/M25/M40 family metallo-hydrolase [Pyrinomonadaceae bacterium]